MLPVLPLENFGNDLIISESLMKSLQSKKPVKKASELQILSNELSKCNVILTRMSRVEEINS